MAVMFFLGIACDRMSVSEDFILECPLSLGLKSTLWLNKGGRHPKVGSFLGDSDSQCWWTVNPPAAKFVRYSVLIGQYGL